MSIPVDKSEGAQAVEIEMAGLIVDTLKLEVAPTEIDPSAPLFGEGLGLDSIDLLEIALAVSRKYGVDLRSGDRAAFGSLHALAAHIDRHRVR